MAQTLCPRCGHEMIRASSTTEVGKVKRFLLCVVCCRRESYTPGRSSHLAGKLEFKG